MSCNRCSFDVFIGVWIDRDGRDKLKFQDFFVLSQFSFAENYNVMKASSYTPDQIIFLKKMNHLLRKKESSNKVEIDIVFEYSLSGTFIKFWEFPAAQHWIMNDGSVFISQNEDWWQKGFPDFGEKWCFAMSLLYDFKKVKSRTV